MNNKTFIKYSKERIYFYDKEAPSMLIRWLKKIRPLSLVDFGCGDGSILFSINKLNFLPKDTFFAGVDLSKERLLRIKKWLPDVKRIRSDVSNVKKLKSNSIQFLICSQVIEHVKSDNQLMKEIHRVVKKEGLIYISSVIKKRFAWWIYKCNGKVTCDPTHLREYKSKGEFFKLIKDNHFSILDSKVSLFKPSPFNVFRRYLIRKGIINENTAINSKLFKLLSLIKIPVFGYHIIEVIAKKEVNK